jgi:hypothetical protein
MAQASNLEVMQVAKRVYGDLKNLVPQDQMLQKLISFSQRARVGDRYQIAATLTRELGFTLGGTGSEAFEINPAVAGTTKQTDVFAYASVLSSVIPWVVASRAAAAGDAAFVDATKYVTRNNLKSHQFLLELMRFHGQSDSLLGTITRFTATYRGVSFTAGTGTLVSDIFGSLSFTNSVSGVYALVSPGQFAPFWVGLEGVTVQILLNGAVQQELKLVGVDADLGILKFDGAVTAPGSSDTLKLALLGMKDNKELIGINKQLTATGTLFGINKSQYSLWASNIQSCATGSTKNKFSFDYLQAGIAKAVNRGGLGMEEAGDLEVLVNPRTWAKLITTEAGKRKYDDSYKPSEVEDGAEAIKFYGQNGVNMIRACRMVKEGEAYGIHVPTWERGGSVGEVTFSVPGFSEVIYPLENQAGFKMSSYSDQFIFCHGPAKNIYWNNINDEATS